jgi:sugar phosphate isomerase/epimerase
MKPILAISNRIGLTGSALVEYALEHGYGGMDWHLHSAAPDAMLAPDDRLALRRLPDAGLEVRFHLSPEVEMAHAAPAIAARAVRNLQQGLDVAARYARRPARGASAGPSTYATVHLACNESPPEALDWATAVQNLSALVEYGQQRGVTVCLENLRTGWTSDPDLFVQLLDQSGARVTFDLGHATSSSFAAQRLAFLDRVASRVVNAHVYEVERKGVGHIAPTDLRVIGPLLESLLYTGCDWWLIELADPKTVERTQALLLAYLE